MRQVFFLGAALLLVRVFMPTLGAALESTLLAFLNTATTVLTNAPTL